MELTLYVMETHPLRHLRGYIAGVIEVPTDDVPFNLEEHISCIPMPGYLETEYCDGIDMLPRQDVTATWDSETGVIGNTLTLSGLPDPCMMYINKDLTEISGGSLEFLLPSIGQHLFEMAEAKYERKHWVLTATAS